MFKITHAVENLPEKFTGTAVDSDGDKYWYLDGKLHRVDGPACEYVDGSKFWYLNSVLHREDGPAIEHSNGDKGWFLNGKRHREDGPACEYIYGFKSWWLNGKRFETQNEWQKELDKSKPTCDGKTVEIDGKKYRLILSEG